MVDDDWANNEGHGVNECTKVEQNAEDFSGIRKLWHWFTLPINTVLSFTIPNCNIYPKLYSITFLLCVVWIGVSSYVICWMVTIFGDTFGIPDVVMGMVFLAFGGSIPEASSAFINSRNGMGTISISNTLGANTLDILISLGIPWFVKCSISSSAPFGSGVLHFKTEDLVFNCIGLICSVLLLNVIAAGTGFKMNKIFGGFCLLSYLCISTLFVLVGLGLVSIFGTAGTSCS